MYFLLFPSQCHRKKNGKDVFFAIIKDRDQQREDKMLLEEILRDSCYEWQ